MVDWNEDGKKDLITGGYDGRVRIFLNTGADSAPVFDGYTLLQVGGIEFRCTKFSFPGVVDWNNDGKKDVFCGEQSGKVNLLINEGSNSAPLFNSQSYVKEGLIDLKVPFRSNPVVADWNGDGKKDLLIGDDSGNIYYYENRGTDAVPLFIGRELMEAGGQIIDTDTSARPDVADWDGDGILDIVCGQDVVTPTSQPAKVLFFHALGPLSLGRNSISVGGGGTIDVHLAAGISNGGRFYLIAGSLSGSAPGTLLPGGIVTIPLNRDWFTDFLLARLNTHPFTGFWGTLGPDGSESAFLNAPVLNAGWVGTTMHLAFATANPWDYSSNAAAIEFVP